MDMQEQTVTIKDDPTVRVLVWTSGTDAIIKIDCEHYGAGAVMSASELDDLLAVLSVARQALKP